MSILTPQFDDSTFAGAYRIRAELALLEKDPALAFQHVAVLLESGAEFSFAAGYLRFRDSQPGSGNEQLSTWP